MPAVPGAPPGGGAAGPPGVLAALSPFLLRFRPELPLVLGADDDDDDDVDVVVVDARPMDFGPGGMSSMTRFFRERLGAGTACVPGYGWC